LHRLIFFSVFLRLSRPTFIFYFGIVLPAKPTQNTDIRRKHGGAEYIVTSSDSDTIVVEQVPTFWVTVAKAEGTAAGVDPAHQPAPQGQRGFGAVRQ
jgi:hypothetical protein